MRAAHHLSKNEALDPGQAIKDLSAAVASLALVVDQLLEAEELVKTA
jgi:hypothetical protein